MDEKSKGKIMLKKLKQDGKWHFSEMVMLIVVLLATVGRIILKMGCPWFVLIASGGADDWYQAEAAMNIMAGRWLGTYNWTTLSKGVSYPLFVAVSRWLNLPLGFTMGLFLVLTAAIACTAIIPLVRSKWARCVVYIVLLYSPIFFASSSLQIYRNALIPIASLGVIAAAVGAYLRRGKIKDVFIWIVIEAMYLSFFWYLREDSIWLLPFCVAASILTFAGICFKYKKVKICALAGVIICIPYLFIGIYTTGIKWANYKAYGASVVNDRTDTAFADVLGLLFKIDDPENTDPDLWLTRRSIEKAFEASPTLATLEAPLMECRDAWAGGAEKELPCDLFGWIIRMIADRAGLYRTVADADAFYEKIRAELTEAFETGSLQEKDAIFLSTQTGGFQQKHLTDALAISLQGIKGIYNYNQCDLDMASVNREIDGENDQIVQAEYILGTSLNRSAAQLGAMGYSHMNEHVNATIEFKRLVNAKLSNMVVGAYRVFNWGYLAVPVAAVFLFIKDRKELLLFLKNNLIWMVGIAGTAFLNLYMVVLYNMWRTRDPMSNVAEYYAPSTYIFVEFIKVICLVCSVTQVANMIKEKNKK